MALAPEPLPHPYPHPVREGVVPLLSPFELQALCSGNARPVCLDVRPPSERQLVHLPGDRHIPLYELPDRARELPTDRPIVTYCQFGSDARRAADYLRQHGFRDVSALEGGLDEYARLVDPTLLRYSSGARDGLLALRQFPRFDSGCLTYLLGDPNSHEAVLVDPGREIEPYLAALHEGPWHLAAIVETHTHADHLAGHAALHARTGAPIYVSHRSPAEYPHQSLAEGDAVEFGGQPLLVLETPGHTRDHLTLRVEKRIFTGDTLLIGACGRTDLGDGSPDLLWESLQDKLLRLPDETEVYPAHFGKRHALLERYVSTIGFERATNEALTQSSREAFLTYMTEGWPPKPTDFDRIVRENLAT